MCESQKIYCVTRVQLVIDKIIYIFRLTQHDYNNKNMMKYEFRFVNNSVANFSSIAAKYEKGRMLRRNLILDK